MLSLLELFLGHSFRSKYFPGHWRPEADKNPCGTVELTEGEIKELNRVFMLSYDDRVRLLGEVSNQMSFEGMTWKEMTEKYLD